jgi:hypothetical protein
MLILEECGAENTPSTNKPETDFSSEAVLESDESLHGEV